MWLGALLLPRIVTLSVGCGPQDGDEGGNCIKSNSCNQGNYCNGNLVCGANNTCVQPGPAPTYPPTVDPCDALLARSPCAAGEEARCRYERTPDPAWNGACAARLRDDAGDTVFCCDTSLPQCSAEYGESTLDPGSSGQSGSEPFSDCPGGPFMCRNLSAPPIDASIECSESPPDDAGWTSLCCVHGDACFELTPQGYPTGPTYYPQGQCAPDEHEYFCTGTASLASVACRAIDAGTAPTQAPAFCCPADTAPTVTYDAAGGDL